MIAKSYLCRAFLISLTFLVGNLQSQTTNTVNREHDVIVIQGSDLQAFDGAPINELFLYAFDAQTETFTQIPFQFDEKGIDASDPMDIDTSYFIVDDGFLDAIDELAFMAKDLGDKDIALGPGHWLSDVISMTHPRIEITITDPIGTSGLSKGQAVSQGWVYLFRSSTLSQEFTDDYVSYTAPSGSDGADTIVGETYTVQAGAKGFYNDLFLPNSPATDLLDRQKIRVVLNIFGAVTEDNFTFVNVRVIDKAVRVIRELDLSLIILNITLPFQYFRSYFALGGDLSFPEDLITQIRQSIDLSSNAIGMTFTNPNNTTPIPIDGQADSPNTQIVTSPMFNYTHITGNQGTIVQLFSIPGNIGDSQTLFYQDETGIGDGGDGDAIGDNGVIVTSSSAISGQFPLVLDLVILGPNTSSSIGADLAQFRENPLTVSTTSQSFDDVVPVELTSFTASVEGTSVRLVWLTESETNNFGFDIERKLAEVELWQKIDFMKGNGTTITPQRYEYIDNDLQPGAYHYRLKQIDTNGDFEYSPILTAHVGVPESFALLPNFPNPFNPSTTISYQIPAIAESAGSVNQTRLIIYNMRGGTVRTLVNEEQPAGFYSIVWNGTDDKGLPVPSGVYVYQLKSGNFLDARKMVLVK